MNRNDLYTARWYLSKGQVPPTASAASDALFDYLARELGALPGQSAPAEDRAPIADTPPVIVDWQTGDLPVIKDVVWMVPPSQKLPIVGAAFTPAEFHAYLATIKEDSMAWSPKGVTIHHTAAPSLAQRPQGFEVRPGMNHMLNLRSYYLSQGWSRGPHLFIDDHKIWVFSPLTNQGIHAVSFNATHFGIEMLGNYDSESPTSGRGAKVLLNAAHATVALMRRFKISGAACNFHRDDPKTSKSCPGKLVTGALFAKNLDAVANL